jgi:hypothetical protein
MIGQRSITARDGAMASLWALGSVVGARGLTFAAASPWPVFSVQATSAS